MTLYSPSVAIDDLEEMIAYLYGKQDSRRVSEWSEYSQETKGTQNGKPEEGCGVRLQR
jgi:hypothetical protein